MMHGRIFACHLSCMGAYLHENHQPVNSAQPEVVYAADALCGAQVDAVTLRQTQSGVATAKKDAHCFAKHQPLESLIVE